MPIRLRRRTTRSLDDLLRVVSDTPVQEASAPAADPASVASTEQPDTEPAPPFLSLREAADWLCVSLSTLKRMISKNELVTLRIGKRRKIPASYLAEYLAKDILIPSELSDIIQSGLDDTGVSRTE